MKTVGIICEYNPFHTGHKYQIEKAREMSGADCVVAVMSGNYVQRGDVSVFSKYERAKSALLGGADIVFELPAYFSLKSAEGFARGAVYMLGAMGVDAISFGAECDNLSLLKETAKIITEEQSDFKTHLRENLKSGKSFAAARSSAFSSVFGGENLILKPNNILAVEYISALESFGIKAEIYPVLRKGCDHDSEDTSENFASASNIRKMISKGENAEKFAPYLPDEKPIFLKDFEPFILYALKTATEEKLSLLDGGSDGLWQRILSLKSESLESLLADAKTKRFALSRIKRLLINLLINNNLPHNLSPSYLRALAMNETGASFLKEGNFSLPVIVKPAKIDKDDKIFALERRASSVRSLADGFSKDDIYMSPIFIK